MKFKNTGAAKTTMTRDINEFTDKLDNIFKAVSIMAKRASQVNENMKEELMEKLKEFEISQDQLDEVFENKEQIAVSKFYEGLPKPWAIAMQELLDDALYMRDGDVSEDEDIDA
jgi:DNA-directed RNA polymerase subunit K/omega